MKKARFWALFMTGVLVFTTLTNDYIVADASGIETEEEETDPEPTNNGYVLITLDDLDSTESDGPAESEVYAELESDAEPEPPAESANEETVTQEPADEEYVVTDPHDTPAEEEEMPESVTDEAQDGEDPEDEIAESEDIEERNEDENTESVDALFYLEISKNNWYPKGSVQWKGKTKPWPNAASGKITENAAGYIISEPSEIAEYVSSEYGSSAIVIWDNFEKTGNGEIHVNGHVELPEDSGESITYYYIMYNGSWYPAGNEGLWIGSAKKTTKVVTGSEVDSYLIDVPTDKIEAYILDKFGQTGTIVWNKYNPSNNHIDGTVQFDDVSNKYSIETYYQNADGTYPDKPAATEKNKFAKQSEGVTYTPEASVEKNRMVYELDSAESVLTLGADELKHDDGVIRVYYSFVGYKADFYLLKTGRRIPSNTGEASTNSNDYEPVGSGVIRPADGSIFDTSGKQISGLIIEPPSGTGEGRDVVWYSYKCVNTGNHTYNVDGYVSNASRTVTYDDTFGSVYVDEFKGINYTIRSEVSNDGVSLTEHPGYVFKGWSSKAKGEVQYTGGESITLNDNLKLYAIWEAGDIEYTVNTYYQKADGSYPDVPDVTEVMQSRFGDEIRYNAPESCMIDGAEYSPDTKHTGYRFKIAAKDVSTEAGENILDIYYKLGRKDARRVYYYVLLPEQTMPADASAQDRTHFYPYDESMNSETYHLWEGTAKYSDSAVYDSSGAGPASYILTIPEAQIRAYLDREYQGMSTDVIWYVYKNADDSWGWHIDGYVANVSVEVIYDKNDGSGMTHTDTLARTGTYEILKNESVTDENGVTITERDGYVFKGWSTAPSAASGTYHGGDGIELKTSVRLYAIWAPVVTGQITITADSAVKEYDGDALTSDSYMIEGDELPEGWSIEAVTSGSLTDAGYTLNRIVSYVIKDESGIVVKSAQIGERGEETVTADSTNINVKVFDGTLRIESIPVTIITESAVKDYDGVALTASGTITGLTDADSKKVTFTVTGTQTDVGSSANSYEIDWGSVNEDNYVKSEEIGTLTVNAVTVEKNDEPEEPKTPDTPDIPDEPIVPVTPATPVTPEAPATPDRIESPTTPETPAITEIYTIDDNETAAEDDNAGGMVSIPDEEVPLAGVLGATRGIEADYSSVLGQRRAAAESGVLGARRDAMTGDANHMVAYLMIMGIATGVGGAYTLRRRRKNEEDQGNA